MGSVGPYGFADLYWQFYATKRDRLDLCNARSRTSRSISNGFVPYQAMSLVVTSPTSEIDEAIARLIAARAVRSRTLLVAPDGRSKFWLIETGPGS